MSGKTLEVVIKPPRQLRVKVVLPIPGIEQLAQYKDDEPHDVEVK